MNKTRTKAIKNILSELDKITEFVQEFGNENNIPDKIINKFCIAFDELLSNTINYGYKDNREGIIVVNLKIDNEYFTAIIDEDADEFDPTLMQTPNLTQSVEDKKIGGLGIHIVKNMMDIFSYERKNNKNIIIISKKIS